MKIKPLTCIKVGKVNIAPHSPVKTLGVWFDSNLSMVDHTPRLALQCFTIFVTLEELENI